VFFKLRYIVWSYSGGLRLCFIIRTKEGLDLQTTEIDIDLRLPGSQINKHMLYSEDLNGALRFITGFNVYESHLLCQRYSEVEICSDSVRKYSKTFKHSG